MRRRVVRRLLPLLAAAMLAPGAQAQRWIGGDGAGGDAGFGAPAPPSRPYGRGYAVPPPPPGWYRAEYGPRGDRPPPRRRRCDHDAGGTILGAIAGGLLGTGVAGHGDRATGAILGAGAGALAGRAIDRGC